MKRKGETPSATTTTNKKRALDEGEPTACGVAEALPLEMVCAVLGWLDVGDLLRFALVCRQWHAVLAPPSVVITISDNEDEGEGEGMQSAASSLSPVGQALWRRAFFNTWPLPRIDALASVPPLAKEASTDEPEKTNWREVALTRLRLQLQNADSSYLARTFMSQLRRLTGADQRTELRNALELGLEQVSLQEQTARFSSYCPSSFKQDAQRLWASTYWTQLRTSSKQKDDDDDDNYSGYGRPSHRTRYNKVTKHRASVVVYSLVTGLPLHVSFFRKVMHAGFDYDYGDEQCELYIGPVSQDDYNDDGNVSEFEEAFFNELMDRVSIFLCGRSGKEIRADLDAFFFEALDLRSAMLRCFAHPGIDVIGPWSSSPSSQPPSPQA